MFALRREGNYRPSAGNHSGRYSGGGGRRDRPSSQPAVGRGQFATKEAVQRDGAQHPVQLLAGARLDVSAIG